jgi:hypothetical protein
MGVGEGDPRRSSRAQAQSSPRLSCSQVSANGFLVGLLNQWIIDQPLTLKNRLKSYRTRTNVPGLRTGNHGAISLSKGRTLSPRRGATNKCNNASCYYVLRQFGSVESLYLYFFFELA